MVAPKFSAYPWHALPRRMRREAALESALARWLAARPSDHGRLRALVGETRMAITRVGDASAIDLRGARCELVRAGETIEVCGSASLAHAIAQHVLGGPEELAAPRPVGAVEQAIWALAVAAAVEDFGIAGSVWPSAGPRASGYGPPESVAIELEVEALGVTGSVVAIVPRALELRAPPARAWPAWVDAMIDVPIVVARCALAREALAVLAVRDLVTVERCCELEVFAGAIGLRVRENAMVAEVATEYVRRAMPLADDAEVELAVTVGALRVPLRRVLELATGEIVQLGRPLAGPFDVRAAGRLIGRGELVDVDGELAVRIVSLEKKSE